MFGLYPWDACSFLRGNKGGVDLRKRKGGGGGAGRKKLRGGCGWDVLYDKRINLKKIR